MTTPFREIASQRGAPPRDRWLLSYADFLTLLLALFIVLYASARLDSSEAEKVVAGLQSAFPLEDAPATPDKLLPELLESAPTTTSREDATLQEFLAAAIARNPDPSAPPEPLNGTRLHEDERGLVVELAMAEFFEAGGAELTEDKKSVLSELAPILKSSGRSIRFEGHTDDQAVANERFPSNWELSAARAGAMARYFIEEEGLDPSGIGTTGFASYRPLVPNLGTAARARNRRVEIVLLRPTGGAETSEGNVAPELESLGRMLDALPPIPSEPSTQPKPAPSNGRRSGPSDLPLP